MSLHTAEEIGTVLEQYQSFAECILEEVRWRDYGVTIDLVFNYIWEGRGRLRANPDQPELRTVTFHGVREFHVLNALTEDMVLSPEDLNWGMAEIALIRLVNDPAYVSRYQTSPVPTHHVACLWEDDRRIDIVFTSLEVH